MHDRRSSTWFGRLSRAQSFIIGVRVEIALLVLLPFFVAMLGTAVAIGLVIALPLAGAVLILIGIVQAPTVLSLTASIASILRR
jgi:hypothetical protein